MLLLRIILILSLVGQLARPPELIFRRDQCGEVSVVKSCESSRPSADGCAVAARCDESAKELRIVAGCCGSTSLSKPESEDAPTGCGGGSALGSLSRVARAIARFSEATREADPPRPPEKSSCGCGKNEKRKPDPTPRPKRCDGKSPAVVVILRTSSDGRCPTGRVPVRCCERVPAPPRKPADQQPTLRLQKIPTTPLPTQAAAVAPGRLPFAPGGPQARGHSPPDGGGLRPTLCVWRN